MLGARPRLLTGWRSAACGFVGAVVATITTAAVAPDALIPLPHGSSDVLLGGLASSFLVWGACALVAGLAAAVAVASERRRQAFATVSAIAATSIVLAARWSVGPFDSPADRLGAIRPSAVLTTDGAPVHVTNGLEVVLDCDVDYWCESVDRVRRARHDADRSAHGSIAIARVEGHWLVARGDHGGVRWANGTAFDAGSLEPVPLRAGSLGGAYALPAPAGGRAIVCALLALTAMLASVPFVLRARRLARAVDLIIDEHGRARAPADAPVLPARPLPTGDAYAWSVDPAIAAYRDDAHPVVDAVPGSRAEALGQAADRAVALQVLALGAIATGFGVMAFAPNHAFVWPF